MALYVLQNSTFDFRTMLPRRPDAPCRILHHAKRKCIFHSEGPQSVRIRWHIFIDDGISVDKALPRAELLGPHHSNELVDTFNDVPAFGDIRARASLTITNSNVVSASKTSDHRKVEVVNHFTKELFSHIGSKANLLRALILDPDKRISSSLPSTGGLSPRI
jgi:hypothetical protein